MERFNEFQLKAWIKKYGHNFKEVEITQISHYTKEIKGVYSRLSHSTGKSKFYNVYHITVNYKSDGFWFELPLPYDYNKADIDEFWLLDYEYNLKRIKEDLKSR